MSCRCRRLLSENSRKGSPQVNLRSTAIEKVDGIFGRDDCDKASWLESLAVISSHLSMVI